MKSEKLENQKLVTKNMKNGNRLPLDRRPILIPEAFLEDKHLVALLKEHGKGYSSEIGIGPLYAAEVLRRMPNNFLSKRLKALFLDERDLRLKVCHSEKMKSYILNVFGMIPDTTIGSYDPKEDEPFVPSKKRELRLAHIIEMPIKGARCQKSGDAIS